MPENPEKTLSNAERICLTVLAIPKGKVATYGQIADLAGLPGRARFVSRAMSLATTKVKLPWYRVLKSDGRLAFPVASKAAIRQTELLGNEAVPVLKNRVNLQKFQWQPELGEILAKLDF